MAIIRLLGRGAAAVCVVSSALAGCSSVERENNLATTQTNSPDAAANNGLVVQYKSDLPVNGQPQTIASQTAGAPMQGPQLVGAMPLGTQPTVALAKTARLPVPVPTTADVAPVQTAAMASPVMAPQLAFVPAPANAGPAMMQPAAVATTSTMVASATPTAQWNAPATSTILAASRQQTSTTKVGRLVSPGVAPAVTEGRIQPAAAAAIALDEAELTPDMVALQSVVPTPRPDRPVITMASAPAAATATLAYASAPHAVAALRAMEFPPAPGEPMPNTAANAPPELAKLIKRYAGLYGVPESLVHRVVHRESKYDPKAYHRNGYWGLMQISYPTAKSMGYEGPPSGLLDAETNLKYAIKYLRGAWLVADNKNDNAIKLYARGYYFDAKRKDMLHVLEK